MNWFVRMTIFPLLVVVSLPAQHPETQKLILENEFVRVLDIRVPPGVLEPAHSHARGVTIAMSDYDNETKSIPEGKTGKGHTTFGEVKWAEPVTHEARNTGKTEQHVVRIEMKKEAPAPAAAGKPGPLDSVVVAKESQKLIFENAYVRAIQDRSQAGETTPKHSHLRGLLVNLSDYDIEVTVADGKVVRSHQVKGAVSWSEPVTHEAKITGTSETWAVRVEVK